MHVIIYTHSKNEWNQHPLLSIPTPTTADAGLLFDNTVYGPYFSDRSV